MTNPVNRIDPQLSTQAVAKPSATSSLPSTPFKLFFDHAVDKQQLQYPPLVNVQAHKLIQDPSRWLAQVVTEDELEQLKRRRRKDRTQEDIDALTSETINQERFGSNRLDITPLKPFLDHTVEKQQPQQHPPLVNVQAQQLIQDPSRWLAQVVTEDELEQLEQRRREDRAQEDLDVLTSETINQERFGTNRLDITPFQLFMDRAIDALESISDLDFRVNDLIEQYTEGKVSIDEVSTEMSKLNLAVSFATTVLSTASQTFKELTQMAI